MHILKNESFKYSRFKILKKGTLMSRKNSQIAMESILIYGLVILVVTLAISALVYFGVLDLGKYLPDSCKIASEGIICENYFVKSSGSNNVQFELRNSVGKNIEGLSVAIVGEEDMANSWGCTGASTPLTSPVANGALSTPIKLTCAITIPVGKKIKGRLDIKYNVVGSSLQNTATGSIYATVSPAAAAAVPNP